MEKACYNSDHASTSTQTGDTCTVNPVPPRNDCPTYCQHGSGPGGRNLIVCIDGTANQFGTKNTNVIELYSLILKDDANQLTWYNSGIGTYARPSWRSFKYLCKVVDHTIDLAIAWNFERTILAAYRWLSENYMKGDRIFLYGFSRGAFQVRVLSAMIEKVGLIHKGNEEQIPFAYELYADPLSADPTLVPGNSKESLRRSTFFKHFKKHITRNDNKPTRHPKNLEEGESMAERFKRTFSHKDVKVHFVGVWDTVSSIGVVREKRLLPGTIDGMKHVCFFRHALALDERRVKFTPEYAYGGTATAPTELDVKPSSIPQRRKTGLFRFLRRRSAPFPKSPSSPGTTLFSAVSLNPADIKAQSESPPHTLEVWFAGTHSDIGGGNAYNAAMDRSRPPLRWMIFESGASGLRTRLFDRPLSPKEQIEVEESLTWHWKLLEILPFRRLTYTRNINGKRTTYKPHLGSPRKIHPGQKIHGSLLRTDQNYIPKALPPNDERDLWITARSTGLRNWMAVDLYESTQALLNKFLADDQNADVWDTLKRTAIMSGDGRQAVYEGVMNVLSQRSLDFSIDDQHLHRLITKATDVLSQSAGEHTELRRQSYGDIKETITNILEHRDRVRRENLRQFVINFVQPRSVVELKEHTRSVSSVVVSPNGERIISGSYDTTIRIWDSRSQKPIGDPLRGHTDWVKSVAISPNGELIASSSIDRTVRIWNVYTGEQVGKPLEGHTEWVMSVAYSPDNKYIVSGSRDNTLRIWDVECGECVGEPLIGHTSDVNAVAYAPDGEYIASGSYDCTVRIWSAQTGRLVGEPLRGHTKPVTSVAFSPDGSRIASGSRDGTVHIWDAHTQTLIGKPFVDWHDGWILSVSFSPDGRKIVSTSDRDGYGRVWDVETRKVQHSYCHSGWVYSAVFSSDGKSVVSGCEDGVVRVWDAELW